MSKAELGYFGLSKEITPAPVTPEYLCEYCGRHHKEDTCPGCGAPKTRNGEIERNRQWLKAQF